MFRCIFTIDVLDFFVVIAVNVFLSFKLCVCVRVHDKVQHIAELMTVCVSG